MFLTAEFHARKIIETAKREGRVFLFLRRVASRVEDI